MQLLLLLLLQNLILLHKPLPFYFSSHLKLLPLTSDWLPPRSQPGLHQSPPILHSHSPHHPPHFHLMAKDIQLPQVVPAALLRCHHSPQRIVKFPQHHNHHTPTTSLRKLQTTKHITSSYSHFATTTIKQKGIPLHTYFTLQNAKTWTPGLLCNLLRLAFCTRMQHEKRSRQQWHKILTGQGEIEFTWQEHECSVGGQNGGSNYGLHTIDKVVYK